MGNNSPSERLKDAAEHFDCAEFMVDSRRTVNDAGQIFYWCTNNDVGKINLTNRMDEFNHPVATFFYQTWEGDKLGKVMLLVAKSTNDDIFRKLAGSSTRTDYADKYLVFQADSKILFGFKCIAG